jgi:hypothetical protein
MTEKKTSAGFTDDSVGFQVEFHKNIADDGHLEAVIKGEHKFYGYLVTAEPNENMINWKRSDTGIDTADDLIISGVGAFSIDPVEIGNAEKITIRVLHSASDGSCKIIPVGVFDHNGDDVGHTPLGELTFAATAVKYLIDTSPDVYQYYSHAQEVDAFGFHKIGILISEITGTNNQVTVWIGPLAATADDTSGNIGHITIMGGE